MTMKLFTETFLDRWEARATSRGKQWEREVPPRWYVAMSPDILLQPTERYTLRLYVRQHWQIVLIVTINLVLWLFPVVFLWYMDPFVVHNPRYHKTLIGLLSTTGFYVFPWIIVSLLTLNCALYLPRFYFWNRRAERLRREPPLPSVKAESPMVDAGVWPPPPIPSLKDHL